MRRSAVLGAVVAGILAVSATPPAAAVEDLAVDGPAVDGPAGEVTVRRDGPVRTVPFAVRPGGEAVLTLGARAPGVSWERAGAESAVVSVSVDGRYATDIVIPSEASVRRSFTLGHLRKGGHRLRLDFAEDRSSAGASRAALAEMAVGVTGDPAANAALVRRHAPVLYGRTLAELGDANQNARTDAPLLAYHEILPGAAPGQRRLQYSVIWSNEDGGTDSPALMARWGRTTDIEWVYQVEVDSAGRRVPGTAVYHGANHVTTPFAGRYEGDRPLLQTCTNNNNLCEATATDGVDAPMRFSLGVDQTLPAGEPREHLMDVNPWTYQVMAREMLREGRLEATPDPATVAVGDQRSYLYVAVAHTASPPEATSSVGLAIGVRLRDDDTLYTSHHGVATSSVNRDGAAATTVELPVGTTASDVAEIVALRVPIVESGASLNVTRVTRAFFLGEDYAPQPSFATWTGDVTLTPAAPAAPLWTPGT